MLSVVDDQFFLGDTVVRIGDADQKQYMLGVG